MLALSVTNACRLPVELPDLFFRWLLLGGQGGRDAEMFEPSIEVRQGALGYVGTFVFLWRFCA